MAAAQLKADPGRLGLESLLAEIAKLERVRALQPPFLGHEPKHGAEQERDHTLTPIGQPGSRCWTPVKRAKSRS